MEQHVKDSVINPSLFKQQTIPSPLWYSATVEVISVMH